MSLLDKCFLYGVQTDQVDQIWRFVIPLLEKAFDFADGKYSIDTIYQEIKKQTMQLWVIFDKQYHLKAICITQIIFYPTEKRLAILFMAGFDMEKWLDLIDGLFGFAKQHDCKSIEVYGRPGWEKALKKYGFEKIHTVMRVKL